MLTGRLYNTGVQHVEWGTETETLFPQMDYVVEDDPRQLWSFIVPPANRMTQRVSPRLQQKPQPHRQAFASSEYERLVQQRKLNNQRELRRIAMQRNE